MRALFETMPIEPGQDLVLLYRAHTTEDLVFRDELDALAQQRRAHVVYLLGDDPHLVSETSLRRLAPGLADRDVYLCGPPPMTAAVQAALGRGRGSSRSGPRGEVRAMTIPSDAARAQRWIPGVALLACASMILVYAAAVLTPAGQVLDTRAMLVVADVLGGSSWTEAVLWLVPPGLVWLATCSIVAVALLKRGPAPALATGVSIVGTVLAAQAPELLLSRPSWLDEAGNSLPSGHVAAIAALTFGPSRPARQRCMRPWSSSARWRLR